MRLSDADRFSVATPMFAMVVRVLRTYADALERPPSPDDERQL